MVAVLRRSAATVGVVVMLPIAYLLAVGSITAEDAGIRSGITLLAVLAARRIAGYLAWLDHGQADEEIDEDPSEVPAKAAKS